MKLYTESDNYKLYQGNMLDMLEVIEANSIDAVLTDPPYELNFMNKGWDNSGIAFQPDTWKQSYEVLKPGGYLLAFGGSRTFHRIACAIEDAGFEIRDTIMWIYGSGFPKSMDISKQIDKKGGNDYSKQFSTDLKQARESRNLTMKYCDDKYCNGSTNWSWYEGRKDGCRVPDYNTYLEIVKDFPELEKYRELIKEAEREVIGKKESGCFNNQEKDRYTIGSSKSLEVNITIPSTDLAKQWQGWGTALKPSFEPIIVARKPFKGSLVDNVIENGVGGINIDECRVEFNDNEPDGRVGKKDIQKGTSKNPFATGVSDYDNTTYKANGRFPANTILTYDETDFDEVCGGFPNTKPAGNKIGQDINKNLNYNASSYRLSNNKCPKIAGDNGGSASRYFMNCKYTGKDEEIKRYIYTPKASKKDRDEGLDTFNQEKVNDGRQTPIDNPFQRGETPRRNVHPCVKPTELMQYLVRLVTPNNGTILDPFNGSGSTGKAVMYENKDRKKNYKYIGIELSEEYLEISKARINFALEQNEEQKKEEEDQISLWQD